MDWLFVNLIAFNTLQGYGDITLVTGLSGIDVIVLVMHTVMRHFRSLADVV